MLENFRRMIRGWLGKALIFLFALPFALFGVSSIFQNTGSGDYIASVNGVEIDQYQLQKAIELRRQSMMQRFGENIPESMLDPDFLRPSVMEGLIERELVNQSASDNNLQYSMEEIKLLIAKETAFHEDGKFSNARYQEILRRAGILPHSYPEELRKDLLADQIRNGYSLTTFVTEKELLAIKKLSDQFRDFKYVSLDPSLLRDKINIDESDIDNYYNSHSFDFEISEKVSIEYVELLRDQFIKVGDVTDSEIDKRFAEKISSLKDEQERQASHILIEINDDRSKEDAKEKIYALYDQIISGADFVELAEENSDDKGSAKKGGDLGFAGKGIFVAEFEEALYGLNKGDVSSPVLTEFGYHIIKLVDIGPKLPELLTIKEEIINEIALDKAEQPYMDALEELRNIAYESADLLEPSSMLKLELKTSGFFSRAGGKGLTENKDIIKTAFSDEVLAESRNSDVLELDSGHAVVIRIKEHQATSVKPLDDVREAVKEKVLVEKSKQKVSELGSKLVAAQKTGTDVSDEFEKYELEWKVTEKIKRNATDIPREITAEVFKMAKPSDDGKSVVKGFQLLSGSYVVVELQSVNYDEEEMKPEIRTQLESSLANQKAVNEFQNYTAWLRDTADVEIR